MDNRDVFIFVHGYNVASEKVAGVFDETYKRMFFTGFRGSFVGYTWQGDEYDINPTSGDRSLFDPNVYNAFQSAPAFRDFLTGPVRNWSGQDATRVNVMAHSLGNLVMYEGLRLAELSAPANRKLVNNVISVEAAIWKEAFEPETELTYPSDGYTRQSFLDNTTYSIVEQKKSTWRFWFRQKDDSGQEHNLKRLVAGKLFNSFNPDDFALNFGMRANDHLMRSAGAGHYWRSLAHANYRTLSDSEFSNDSMERIAAMMRKRTLVYGYTDLNLPLGAVDTSPGSINANSLFTTVAAREYGWPEESHGAAFYQGDKPDGLLTQPYDVSMPVMSQWYTRVFSSLQAVRLGNG